MKKEREERLEGIKKYHLWLNLVFGLYGFIVGLLSLIEYNFNIRTLQIIPGAYFLDYPFTLEAFLFLLVGILSLIYYLTRFELGMDIKSIFDVLKFILLSALNIISFFIFPRGLFSRIIPVGYSMSFTFLFLIFFYSLYLKWEK